MVPVEVLRLHHPWLKRDWTGLLEELYLHQTEVKFLEETGLAQSNLVGKEVENLMAVREGLAVEGPHLR